MVMTNNNNKTWSFDTSTTLTLKISDRYHDLMYNICDMFPITVIIHWNCEFAVNKMLHINGTIFY